QEPVLFFRPAPDRASAAGPRVLLTFVPLRDRAGKVRGAMEIVRLAATIDTKLAAARREFWVSIGLLTTVLGILVWIAVRQSVLRPIRQLMAGVHALATGRPEPIDAEGRDEFARLARAFNEMADRLAEAHRRLVAETEARLDLARQVRQAEQLAVAGRLASELAHEIGTPLNVISGRAEYVQRELPPGSRVAGQLDIIVKQIDRISGIIASLLDVVRPAKAEIQPIALGPLLRGVVELLRPSAARQGLTLHAELAGSVRVLGDPNQLQQVAINLLVNAIEATPRGGHVVLRAREEGADGAELEVRDSGTGIAPEHVQRVFDPFFTTKPPGRGTGLGLAICRDIVREHGGTITV
ncbi:MAG TPA: ATP-binding protein, partial [Solirubrobacterales bacterium]|nr:ATP-binding protein [Solirubrobacterales bacterium]